MPAFDLHEVVTCRSAATGFETIHDVIDQIAMTQPEATFLLSPDAGELLTFGGLQQQARNLTGKLQQLGLTCGDKVAFLMDNGLITARLFLGLMYGGFVAVPLNVGAGASQLSYTLDHSDAKVIYISEEYRALVEALIANLQRPIHLISADLDASSVASETLSTSTKLMVPRPEDPALLMYTSGSTGRPKAAVHSHSTVVAHGRNSISAHQLTTADRSLLVLPLYHINAECVTLVPTLMSGGSVVVPRRFSVSQFWDWLDEYRCTWSAVVPTIISQLLDWRDPRADSRGAAFKRIRFLRCSSAPLAPSLHREFLEKFKILLIQAMGSSEAGNVFSNPLPPGENKVGSPGIPWGFETKIVDRKGVALLPGESGEVMLRGAGLAQGYYKEPEATAAAFDSEGWFHTGDLAYRDEDGYFFVVGRSKELIIKGGVNIAPRQIDDVLESHPAVLEAAAVGVPDHYLGEDLVAFVVRRCGVACDERELLNFCENHLGLFKTPTRIHFADDLPKGPSGKVQRLRLREDATQSAIDCAASSRSEFEVVRGNGHIPQNELLPVTSWIEQVIAECWAEVLSQPQIDSDSNFFALGGHSLLAVQCMSLLREKIPTPLSLSDFFENATIAQQAALVRRRLDPDGRTKNQATTVQPPQNGEQSFQNVSSSVSPAIISPRDRSLPYHLTAGQRRLWFLEQLNPGALAYNEAEAVRLLGELNVDAMERALSIIVARHEVLRTTIQLMDNEPVAVVQEIRPFQIKKIDLSALEASTRQDEVQRLLVKEPRHPYHLDAEPGIRATLLSLGLQEHVFILMMHHIICDWSSLGVFWRELSALYSSLSRGELPSLAPLTIQHGDYALWQAQHNKGTSFAEDLAFWKENLRGAPQLLELPADRTRPPSLSYRGAKQRFILNPTLTQTLRKLGQQAQVTLFTVFGAALNTLLYRYTGQEDILLGIPIADRDRKEMQSMMGFLLHVQVLRTTLSEEMTFRELLVRVQKAALDLYLHRAVPFDQVVQKVQPERNLSYSPLFQVMLNWRDRDQMLSFIGLEGVTVESLLAEARTSKFDLTLFATDCGDEIWLEAEYSTDLFDDVRVARLFDHYQALLEAVAANPDQRLHEPQLLTSAERQQVVEEFNATERAYPQDASLVALIEAQVERTPDAVAVVFGNSSLTYQGLNERANQLGHYLREMSVGPDTLVGVFMERSVEMVVALYGILKAGGAYVPIDPDYPADRVAFMLEDARVRVLLTQSKFVGQLPKHDCRLVCLDIACDSITTADTANPTRTASPSNLAYMIYTSGSTGRPKGAMNEHRGIVNRLLWIQGQHALTEADTIIQKTPFSFDISVWEFFWPLLAGARLVVAKPGGHRDAAYLVDLIVKERVTVLHFVPSMLQVFLDQPDVRRCQSLRHVICSGEALPFDLQEKFFKSLPAQLHNLYGPTEAAVEVTHWICQRNSDRKIVPIGRPVANTQIYILDRHLQPMPIGVMGELYIGGVQVCRGYHNRPELTAEKFIPDPFSEDPRARLYKTGDVCRWLSDGSIEYWGRADFQVKIRGYRIELGEIEAALKAQPEIKQAVVVARDDKRGDKRLVAYVVSTGTVLVLSELRTRLKRLLPDYMVPADYVVLDSIPVTPNGKVDRLALRAPEPSALLDDASYLPPQDAYEGLICEAWADVLGLKRVGIRDNFFDLGGHSLLAVQLMLRLQEIIPGEPLPLRAVLEAPTVEKFAAWLRNHKAGERQFLVRMRPGISERPPFFSVHGAGGNVLDMRALAMALPADLPFYCFEDKGLDDSTPFESIEEVARCYIDEIRQVQPHGPYYLGGSCYGGIVAFEMARRLEELGEPVAALVLIDSLNPTFVKSLSKGQRLLRNVRFYMRRTGWHARRIFTQPPGEWLGYIGGALKHFRDGILDPARAVAIHDEEMVSSIASNPIGEILKRTMRANLSARRKFEPRPYNGSAMIFRASERNLYQYDDYRLGWGSVVRGGIECFEIEGAHESILDQPAVQLVAEKLDIKLRELAVETKEVYVLSTTENLHAMAE
jgi:amino acid adenylation domain-containing protein